MASADQFLRVVEHLLDEGVEGRQLLALEDTAAFIAMEDSSLAIVIHPTKRGPQLLDALSQQLGRNPKVHHKLVMIGGGAEMRPLLAACQPGVFGRRMVQVYQLANDGEIWSGRASRLDSSVGRALEAAREVEDPIDGAALAERVVRPSKEDSARVQEHRTFLAAYRGVRPSVTIGAVGLILGVYGLQMTWGGGSFLPTLARMGANTAASLHGEPWRLLASTLLHGNVLHVVMNAFVLYVLGAHLERILGWRRQLVLLVVAGLCGSLVSTLRPEAALSVGASGAIWGLLGAALGVAVRPGDLVPASIVKNLKIAALANLVINLSVSFLPGVDMMAHLGGGVAGAVLTFSGLLTRGLRPVVQDPARRRGSGRGWTLAAWGAGAITVGSLAVACVVGKPWVLGRPPVLETVHLEGTPYEVHAPSGVIDHEVSESGAETFSLGDPYTAPFFMTVAVEPWLNPGLASADEIEMWRHREPAVEAGAEFVSSSQVTGDGPPAYDEVHSYPEVGTLYLRYMMFDDAQVTVSAFVFDGGRESFTAAAKAAAGSLEFAP